MRISTSLITPSSVRARDSSAFCRAASSFAALAWAAKAALSSLVTRSMRARSSSLWCLSTLACCLAMASVFALLRGPRAFSMVKTLDAASSTLVTNASTLLRAASRAEPRLRLLATAGAGAPASAASVATCSAASLSVWSSSGFAAISGGRLCLSGIVAD